MKSSRNWRKIWRDSKGLSKFIERIRRTSYIILMNSTSSIVSRNEVLFVRSEWVCEFSRLYIVLFWEAGTCKPIITLSHQTIPKQWNDMLSVYDNDIISSVIRTNFIPFVCFFRWKTWFCPFHLWIRPIVSSEALETEYWNQWKKLHAPQQRKELFNVSRAWSGRQWFLHRNSNWKNSNKSLSADVSTLDDKVCDEWIKFYVSDSRFIFCTWCAHKKSQSQVNLANL